MSDISNPAPERRPTFGIVLLIIIGAICALWFVLAVRSDLASRAVEPDVPGAVRVHVDSVIDAFAFRNASDLQRFRQLYVQNPNDALRFSTGLASGDRDAFDTGEQVFVQLRAGNTVCLRRPSRSGCLWAVAWIVN